MQERRFIYKYGLHLSVVFATIVFLILSGVLHLPSNYLRKEFIFSDVDTYLDAADLLYNHGFTPHNSRPWGYALILGLPYIFNSDASINTLLTWSVVVNLFAYLGAVYLMYKISCKWFGSKIALITTLLFILTVSNALMIYQAMTEPVFIFLLLLCISRIQSYIATSRKTDILIALFCLCFTAIMRPVTYPLTWLSLIVSIWLLRKNFVYAFAACLIFGLTVGTQLFLMNRHYGLKTVSTISNYTLYHYLGAKAQVSPGEPMDYATLFKHMETPVREAARQDSATQNGKSIHQFLDKRYSDAVKQMFADNPASIFRSYYSNIFSNSKDGCSVIPFLEKDDNTGSFFNLSKRGIWLLTIAQNILFSFVCIISGFILAWQVLKNRFRLSKEMVLACILQCLCFYFVLTSGISFWQGDRFNYIWYGLMILITTYLLVPILKRKNTAI